MKFKRRDDFYRDRNKLVSFLFKVLMFIGYPLRHPIIFVGVLIVLYLAPTFNGVKPTEVNSWYWQKITAAVAYVSDGIGEKAKGIMSKTDNIIIESPFAAKGTDKLVKTSDMRAKNVRRQIFEKSKSTPQAVDILQQKDYISEAAPVIVPNEGEEVAKARLQMNDEQMLEDEKSIMEGYVRAERHALEDKPDDDYRRDIISLNYLDNPKIVNGLAVAYDANTIAVEGNYLILFGIYANSVSDEGRRAKQFMNQIIGGQPVICKVVAYTYDKMPTAICYVNEVNINKQMVIKGYSKNMAL